MATVESVKAKLQGLIDRSNGVTGESHGNLSDAVDALAAGYGQGGGLTDDVLGTILERGFTDVVIPAGTKNIGLYSFAACRKLASVSIPEGVTTINGYAFFECVSLTSIDFPDSLKTIGTQSFRGATGLTDLTIPANVESIQGSVFQNCTNLKTVRFLGTPLSILSTAFYVDTNITDIYVPWSEGAVANAPWGATNATVHYNYTGEA